MSNLGDNFYLKSLLVPEIYLIDKCNQQCIFCSASANSPDCYIGKELNLEEIKEKLKEIRKFSAGVLFSGGEPTLSKYFFDALKVASALSFEKIIIESNGQNFSQNNFLQKTLAAGGNLFRLSMHAPSAKLSDFLTGTPGSFEKTIAGIDNLKKSGQSVHINVVVNKMNYHSLPKTMKLLESLKVDSISLSFIFAEGDAEKNKKIVPMMKEVVPYLRQAVKKIPGKRITIVHLPFCLLGDLVFYSTWVKFQKKIVLDNPNYKITIEPKDTNSVKNVHCKKCRYDNICFGIRSSYADIYGLKEIRPISGKKIQQPEIFFKAKRMFFEKKYKEGKISKIKPLR